jgi:hypothetical protein
MTPKPDIEPVATLVERLREREAQCRRLAYPDHPPIFVELAGEFAEAASALLALEGERDALQELVDFAIRWSWRDSPITDSERLSAIKYHPTLKKRAETAGYLRKGAQ